ncbi:NB-ARC domain-containing protein [Actinomadura sp. WMMB 499]|uniref:ATP-binding protein n=1 Tax=Actinomadura sp. WMMB 499 TaxID=1219491 RepID=UPI0012449FE3|nr:NB-ARC domain-containing protein [Actinomadura sp. WMMB 499]QFG26501.1 regulator [Actinomadura sp. WMMB 499]
MNTDSGCGGHLNRLDGGASGWVIQARDVRGGVHVHAPPPGVPAEPPRQLPGPGLLVDRTEAIDELDGAGAAPPGVALVTGPAGVGKTATALHWAHRRLEAFPDGQLYADLRAHAAVEHASPGDVLAGFLAGLGVAPAAIPSGLAARTALYRSLTAGRRMLVVLDDAYSAAQVTPLLPASADGVAVVTSRWRLAALLARGARAVLLRPLETDAAVELLDRMLGRDRIAAERDMAARLVELCGRSPLALSVAGARLAARPGWPLAELVGALTEETRRLAALTARDAEDDMTVRAALELSYRNLPAPARRLYRLLAVHPGHTYGSAACAALTGGPAAEAGETLEALADANLVADAPGARYRLHELTRLHALELADAQDPPSERAAALLRLVRWTAAAALAANAAAAPYRRLPEPPEAPGVPAPPSFPSAREALDWLDSESVNLSAVAARAQEAGHHEEALLIVDAAWPLFLHRGHRDLRLDLDLVGLAAARSAGDRAAEAKMLNRTGLAWRDRDRPDRAAEDFLAARDIWRELGDRPRTAGSERRLGLLELDRGDAAAARRHFRTALGVHRDGGDDRKTALCLCDLGAALLEDGHRDPAARDEAAALLTEARALLEGGDDPYNRARALVLLGRARAGAPDAEEQVTAGLAAMRELGSAAGVAGALRALGDLAARDGRDATALHRYEEARATLAAAGAPTRVLDRLIAGLRGT